MQIAAFQVVWGKSSDFSWKTNQYTENDLFLYRSIENFGVTVGSSSFPEGC